MNWRRAVMGAGVSLPIIALLAYGMTIDPKALPSTLPGRPAPEFALRIMDSTPPDTVRLSDHRGDVVVLNFWASWCLECRVEHSDLSLAATTYASHGVKFYGILYSDSEGNGRSWIRDMGGQAYPALIDDRSRTAISYGLYGVPETFVIDQEGRVVHKQIGPITARQLSSIIEPLLAVEPTEPAPTDAADQPAGASVPPAES
jgi:cytochrome c biogenesis protein CcmG, thiol:disulfide interchange protein DsbE